MNKCERMLSRISGARLACQSVAPVAASVLICALVLAFVPLSALAASESKDAEAEANLLQHGQPTIPGYDWEAARTCHPQFELLSKVLSPAVVNISVEGEIKNKEDDPHHNFPFFKKDSDRPVRSLGSGFIVSPDGHIVTNNHVVDKSDKIIVRLLDDKTEYIAAVIGSDEKTDLALIKIEADKELSSVFLGNSDELSVGEWVLAIGNQFQLGQTVTAGIVSAKSRKVPTKMSGPYDDFIQTDASINPGSSGGPLFNTRGQVVGINTAIFSPGRSQFGGTGFNIGIGFAIPINIAGGIIEQLKLHGRVTRGLLGVIIQHVSTDVSEALGLPGPDGALVADIIDGSPAQKAGFMVKDVIIGFEGRPVSDHDDLPLMVASTPVGTSVAVEVIRGGARKILRPIISELTEASFPRKAAVDKPQPNEIGLITQDITGEMADSMGLDSTIGAIVSSVETGSAAYSSGIVRGDVIVEFNNHKVSDKGKLEELLKSAPRDEPLLVLVRRREGTRFLTLRIK